MKTLIVYASTYGYTKDCVEELKKQLGGDVVLANVMSGTIPALDSFDNIIIGGSIYMGQIQKKVKLFCSKNMDEILTKRLGLFLCCGLPENFLEHLNQAFNEELIKKALVKECFGGELRTEKMNFAHKAITNLMKKAMEKDGKLETMQMPGNIKKLAEIMNKK